MKRLGSRIDRDRCFPDLFLRQSQRRAIAKRRAFLPVGGQRSLGRAAAPAKGQADAGRDAQPFAPARLSDPVMLHLDLPFRWRAPSLATPLFTPLMNCGSGRVTDHAEQPWDFVAPGPVRHALTAHRDRLDDIRIDRSEEHTSELQSLMRISYAVFCLQKKKDNSQRT